jgi:hypothetical protein
LQKSFHSATYFTFYFFPNTNLIMFFTTDVLQGPLPQSICSLQTMFPSLSSSLLWCLYSFTDIDIAAARYNFTWISHVDTPGQYSQCFKLTNEPFLPPFFFYTLMKKSQFTPPPAKFIWLHLAMLGTYSPSCTAQFTSCSTYWKYNSCSKYRFLTSQQFFNCPGKI